MFMVVRAVDSEMAAQSFSQIICRPILQDGLIQVVSEISRLEETQTVLE